MDAYVLSGEMWAIIDIADPESPTTISETHTDRMNYRASKAGDALYIGEDRIGLKVYDVSDPEAPKLVRTVPNTAGIFDLAIQDDVLYLACHGNGVKAMDITNPLNPVLTDTYRDGGEAYGCHIVEDILLVADLQEGIKILDVSDLEDITLLASFTGTHPHGITGDLNYIYLADQDHGLEVFQYGEGIETTVLPETPEPEPGNRIPMSVTAVILGLMLYALTRRNINP